VAELFEAFNTHARQLGVADRVEVVQLLGPTEATRTSVLRHIMLHAFDVLHYAGHCIYDEADPASSGWVFTAGERISINEMRRIDRIPKFIFSNACQSGITPDRSEARDDRLAPSFAEGFFERGVSNFVCCSWPIGDLAARRFALKLYGGLFGLDVSGEAKKYEPVDRKPMHVAMQNARLSIAATIGGRTWGAYQHYGNPYFRLFAEATWPNPQSIDRSPPAEPAVSGTNATPEEGSPAADRNGLDNTDHAPSVAGGPEPAPVPASPD
jgi:hypothetical protein